MNQLIKDYYNNRPISEKNFEEMISLIKDDKIKFPYIKYRLKEDEINKKFDDLKNYKYTMLKNYSYKITNLEGNLFFSDDKIIKYDNYFALLIKEPEDYLKYNILSDYFNENCRMKCKRYNSDSSPYKYWKKNPEKVIRYALKKYKKVNIFSLRESIYKLTDECTSFRPTLMVSIIDMFKVKKILDFSSGWGDRLIGAISKDIWYYGVDPNPCLHENYKKIIDMFAKNNKHKYTVIQSGFEDAPLPDWTYDMVFTSPPYFTLEKYVDDADDVDASKGQSIDKYKELNDWLDNFLFYSIDKAWTKLEIGGHFIIIINNIRHFPDFIQRMIKRQTKLYASDTLTFSKYLGKIGYTERTRYGYKSPQPMWIWKKLDADSVLNPPVIIKDVSYGDNIFHVIREDKLKGGLETRFWYKYLLNNKADTYVYTTSSRSPTLASISYVCKLLDKKLIVFINKLRTEIKNIPPLEYALSFGNMKIKETESREKGRKRLHERIEIAKKYANNLNNSHYIDFAAFKNMYTVLATHYKKAWINKPDPKILWLASSRSDIVLIFNEAFPNTFINIVQFGMEIDKSIIDEKRNKIWTANERFNEPAKHMPPYPTVLRQDAKIWQFVTKYGKDGDYILNRSRDYGI